MGQALKTAQTVTEEETLAAIDRSIECLQNCEHPKRQFILITMSADGGSHSLRLACSTHLLAEAVDSLATKLKSTRTRASSTL